MGDMITKLEITWVFFLTQGEETSNGIIIIVYFEGRKTKEYLQENDSLANESGAPGK